MVKAGQVVQWTSVAASCVFLASGVQGAEPRDRTLDRSVVEVPMQVSYDGMTHEEYLQRQADLSSRLLSETPKDVSAHAARIELTAEELRNVDTAQATIDTPLQIGLVKPLNPRGDVSPIARDRAAKDSRGSGVLTRSKDGDWIWALEVGSTGAGALRVHIENMSLPQGAELYFHSRDGQASGPYTGSGPNTTGEFWTESVFGAAGILQLTVPASANDDELRDLSLSVTEIGHIGQRFAADILGTEIAAAGFCGNETCIVDATCVNGTPADPAKLAIAKYEWIAGAFIYTCSGGLINDTNPSQNNFFLTANHCISKNSNAQNAQFYWRFASSTCNGSCPSNTGWPYKTAGATVSATGRKGDFTLMHLNSNPPAGSVLLGWTTTAVANTNGVDLWRISNPNFGPQVYSQHRVSTSAPTCTGWPRGERIYSKDITGATDGGSSGSPVVNGSSQIVGQLSGACGTDPNNVCNSTANATVDGAFAYYFNSVKPYINP